jgi:hypothetical protein
MLIKIVVTAIAGGLTYLLTNATHEPQIWQLTMSIFVAGLILVVQFLIDSAEQSRLLLAEVREIHQAAAHLATAEGHLGRGSLTRLVESAGRLNPLEELQLRFARHQVDDLANLLEGLRSGRAEHEGEDPDWLLGLTRTARKTIDATSLTSLDQHRGFVDEGDFWASDLGLRYLDLQRKAIERGVTVRRLFLLTEDAIDEQALEKLLAPHRQIGVVTNVVRPEHVHFLHQNDLEQFILFDGKISYEFHTAQTLRKDATPLIASVALVVEPRLVRKRQERFEDLWSAARVKESITDGG